MKRATDSPTGPCQEPLAACHVNGQVFPAQLLVKGQAVRHVTIKGSEEVEIPASESAACALYVWKTMADPFAGRITMFRVLSGSIKGDANVLNQVYQRPRNFFQSIWAGPATSTIKYSCGRILKRILRTICPGR